MRDHLLGCAQFIPDVENERVMPLTKAKPYALGIPTRVYAEDYAGFQKESTRAIAFAEFEDYDHTPAGMMADFPREYDLKTMLGEAADRRYAMDPFFDPCDLALEDATNRIKKQIKKIFNINNMVLNANKSTRVGVDLGKPGGDMSAVAVRHGSEMEYPVAWDSLFPKPPATPKQALKVDTYPTSAEIKDFYKRAALSKVEDWERMVFEGRLALGKPTAQQ